MPLFRQASYWYSLSIYEALVTLSPMRVSNARARNAGGICITDLLLIHNSEKCKETWRYIIVNVAMVHDDDNNDT